MAYALWALTRDRPLSPTDVATLLGLPTAVAGLAVAVAGLRHAQQEPDPTVTARYLAERVERTEERQWRQFLGGDTVPLDVRFAFRPAPARTAAVPSNTGHLEEVAAYFRAVHPQRLVVTGGPGAGKTVLAVQLILALLHDRADDDPVPVRLSAASCPGTVDLAEWLIKHLVDIHELPLPAARDLVEGRRVLPVLDGLDEADGESPPPTASRAAQIVEILNTYQDGRHRAPVVLTCRTDRYEVLAASQVRLLDAARVELAPVTADQAHDYLSHRTLDPPRWQPVLEELQAHPTGALASALSSPWRLTLAATVYDSGGDPADLVLLARQGRAGEQMVAQYVDAAVRLQQDAGPMPYQPEQVNRFLRALAHYLHGRGGQTAVGGILSTSDLVLHTLWPFAGKHRPRLTDAVLALLAWVPLYFGVVALCETVLDGAEFWRVALPLAVPVLAAASAWAAWAHPWPLPRRADLRRLPTMAGLRRCALGFLVGMTTVGALAAWLATATTRVQRTGAYCMYFFGALPADADRILNAGMRAGLLAGAVAGAAGAVMAGAVARVGEDQRAANTARPRAFLRADLTFRLVTGSVAAVCGVLATWLGVTRWLTTEAPSTIVLASSPAVTAFVPPGPFLITGVTCAAALAFAFGALPSPSRRYAAFLLCVGGRQLPWRIGPFMDWACQAGLLRTAGGAYQFRHRELQEWLARQT
ncbi:NACHT domain-containing protein [Streptomyces chartreusis]|uniref:NACHT domain-containing protein n=1 Tax=Streptomyces chartreusis TaxID=1969 RepID=A0A7H8TKN1_STRCX|nr:NACHT domain-containing protein [Streptomyces chartreusis]QKZ23807.1 NACHT domain-containing protein [Streptomyces chartreusis]